MNDICQIPSPHRHESKPPKHEPLAYPWRRPDDLPDRECDVQIAILCDSKPVVVPGQYLNGEFWRYGERLERPLAWAPRFLPPPNIEHPFDRFCRGYKDRMKNQLWINGQVVGKDTAWLIYNAGASAAKSGEL